MKTVFNNDMTVHVWAQNSQDNGRNSNGSIFFEGGTIYSYGRHFPMGKILDMVTLITTQTYSNTTSAHLSLVRQAVSGRVFHVDNVEADCPAQHADNFKKMSDNVDELLKKASRARTNKEWLFNSAIYEINHANQYAEFFGIENRLGHDDINLDNIKSAMVEREKLARKKINDYYLKYRGEWLNGYHVENLRSMPVMLRLKDDETIETSQRASFPLSHFKKLWPMVKKLVDSKKSYKRDGSNRLQLGYFTIDSISKSGTIKAGCHIVKWFEINDFYERNIKNV